MRLSSYANRRILALLITAGLIVAQPYIPQKVTQLYPHPDPNRYTALFGALRAGEPTIEWIDKEKNHFWCDYAPGDPYSCEWSLNMAPDRPAGMDLTEYSGLNIYIRYQGNAPRIRFLLRDFNPAFSDIADIDATSKAMTTTLKTTDLDYPTFTPLSEFSVAEWWITQHNAPREHTSPSMHNIISLGVSFNVYSHNDIQIDRVEVVGEWVQKERLYFVIILLWMSAILFEVVWRFYLIHKQAKADVNRISQLANEFKALQSKKEELEVLSTTDVLTGIMNRAGIQQILDMLFDPQFIRSNLGILVFDIDHFKLVNDQYGHDTGDQVLTAIAQVICKNVRQSDVLGRWGGEEFILICPQITREQVNFLAEKIRVSIEQQVFSTQAGALRVTTSIGVTIVDNHESFEAAFKRADTALYAAKNNGRNQVQLA